MEWEALINTSGLTTKEIKENKDAMMQVRPFPLISNLVFILIVGFEI